MKKNVHLFSLLCVLLFTAATSYAQNNLWYSNRGGANLDESYGRTGESPTVQTANGAPSISIDPDTIFIHIYTNELPSIYRDTVRVQNTGDATLLIDSVEIDSPFNLQFYPDSIVANATGAIIFAYTNYFAGGIAYLTISTNDPVHPVDTFVISTTVTGIDEQANEPTQYSLSQNYPNPFSTITNVEYRIPNEGLVTLKVYNSLGGEVATLVNSEQSAGEHNATFDAHDLQNGMYFYRLTTGKFTQSGKMAVIH